MMTSYSSIVRKASPARSTSRPKAVVGLQNGVLIQKNYCDRSKGVRSSNIRLVDSSVVAKSENGKAESRDQLHEPPPVEQSTSNVRNDDRPAYTERANPQVIHTMQTTHTIFSDYSGSYFVQRQEQTQSYFDDLEEFPRLGATKPRKRSTSETCSKTSSNEGQFETSGLSPYAKPFVFQGYPYPTNLYNGYNDWDYQNGVEAYDETQTQPPKPIENTEEIQDNGEKYPEYMTDLNCASISLSRKKYMYNLSADAKPFEFKKRDASGEEKTELAYKKEKAVESRDSPKRTLSVNTQPFVPRKYEQMDFRSAISFSLNPNRQNSVKGAENESKSFGSEKNSIYSWRRATPDTDPPKSKIQESTSFKSENSINRQPKATSNDFTNGSFRSLSDSENRSAHSSPKNNKSYEEESDKKKYPLMPLPSGSSNNCKQKSAPLRPDAKPFTLSSKANGLNLENEENSSPNLSAASIQKQSKEALCEEAIENKNVLHCVGSNKASPVKHNTSSDFNKTITKVEKPNGIEKTHLLLRKADKAEWLADNRNAFNSNMYVWKRAVPSTAALKDAKLVPHIGAFGLEPGQVSLMNNYCSWSDPNHSLGKPTLPQHADNKSQNFLTPSGSPCVSKAITDKSMHTTHNDVGKNEKNLKINENNCVKPFDTLTLSRSLEKNVSLPPSRPVPSPIAFVPKQQLSEVRADKSENRSGLTEDHRRNENMKIWKPAESNMHTANSNAYHGEFSRHGMSVENGMKSHNGSGSKVMSQVLPGVPTKLSTTATRDEILLRFGMEKGVLPVPSMYLHRNITKEFESEINSSYAAFRSNGINDHNEPEKVGYNGMPLYGLKSPDIKSNSMEIAQISKPIIPPRATLYQTNLVEFPPRNAKPLGRQNVDREFATQRTSTCSSDTNNSQKFTYKTDSRITQKIDYRNWKCTNIDNDGVALLQRNIDGKQDGLQNISVRHRTRRFNPSENILNLINADSASTSRSCLEAVPAKPLSTRNYHEIQSARLNFADLNKTSEPHSTSGDNILQSARICPPVQLENSFGAEKLYISAPPNQMSKESNRTVSPEKTVSAAVITKSLIPPPIPPRRRVPSCPTGASSVSRTPVPIADGMGRGIIVKPNIGLQGVERSVGNASSITKHQQDISRHSRNCGLMGISPVHSRITCDNGHGMEKESMNAFSTREVSKLPTEAVPTRSHPTALSPRVSTRTNPFLDDYVEEDDNNRTAMVMPTTQPIVDPPKDPLWLYIAPSNEAQGPFTSIEMAEWFNDGYFGEDLKIRRICDERFVTIEEFIKLTGSSSPFLESSSVPPLKVKPPIVSQFTNPFHEFLMSKV